MTESKIASIRRPVVLASLGFLVLLFASRGVSAEELAPVISPVELRDRLQQVDAPQVIDVRSPAEFETGHVPGAVNIPHDELAKRLDEVNAASGVVLYCMIGPRARLGEAALREAGIDGLLHLAGGFAAWREEGLPEE